MPKPHVNQIDHFPESKAIFSQVFLVVVDLNNDVTQTLQVFLLLFLPNRNLQLYQISGD